MALVPVDLEISGSDLTGNNNETDRTYTISDSNIQSTPLFVFVSGQRQKSGAGNDYTFDGTDTLTFLNPVNDLVDIVITYYVDDAAAIGDQAYCSVADVQRILLTTFSYSGSTVPTSTQVTSTIIDATYEIENRTHHAWRAVTVSDEHYDVPTRPSQNADFSTGVEVHLRHREIRSIDSGEGDQIEVWDGDSWDDWVSTKTEGRANDYWFDYEQGTLFLRHYGVYYRRKGIRLTYRYGAASVPPDIRRACAMMAAIDILRNNDMTGNTDDTGNINREDYETRVNQMQAQVDRIIRNHTEIFVA